jgi:hypothetical protein
MRQIREVPRAVLMNFGPVFLAETDFATLIYTYKLWWGEGRDRLG